VIDLHCHVLPGIDDGPPTLGDSLDLLDTAEAAGIATVVATPHVSARYRNDAMTVQDGLRHVRAAASEAGIAVDVQAGAEISMSRLGDLADEELCRLRLGAGPWLLIECPLEQAAGDVERVLDAIHRRGHWIVLAHPERSPLFRRAPARLRALVDQGMLCSVTAGSLTGAFGHEVRDFAVALVREGLVHNITSDAHDAVRRPPSVLDDVIAAARDAPELLARITWLTEDIPRAVLAGDALPPPPPASDVASRRGRRAWLGRML
jgi:protein-tyrosine phosphatase